MSNLTFRRHFITPEHEANEKSKLLFVPALNAYVAPAKRPDEKVGAMLHLDSQHYPSSREISAIIARKT